MTTFKVLAPITNVRPSKSESPELNTAPNKGMIKVNTKTVSLMGLKSGEFLVIVPAQDENGNKDFYITTGNAKTATTGQVGAILSSNSESGGGSLSCGSENAWRELGGNKNTKEIYSVSETPVDSDGKSYYKLTHVRSENKVVRVPKGEVKHTTKAHTHA